jgi:ribose transport system ATP-binding protein
VGQPRPHDARSGPADAVPALEVSHISKTFGSARVLQDVSLTVHAGEVRALVGENGSGKSTLVKILAGNYIPDNGAHISVGGQPVRVHQPGTSDEAGLRFVHQSLGVIDALSATENLGLGLGYSKRARPVHWSRRHRAAREVMRQLGYDIDVRKPLSKLAASERAAVAIARAVSPHHSRARLLVLDEPTATLPAAEAQGLFALVRRLRSDGVAVLFISHHINEVFDIADSVSVLRGGSLVATRSIDEIDEPALIELMLGRSIERSIPVTSASTAPAVLQAADVSAGSLRELSLEIRTGEIVGVAGITGSGREAVAPALYGARSRSGRVDVAGKTVRSGRPDLSIAAGMGYIPADRDMHASFPDHDVAENISIARLGDFVRATIVRRRAEGTAAAQWIETLDIRPREPRYPLQKLSGGNMQKVILARWLRLKPRVLLLDEPTQGVDIGAREQIYRMIDTAAQDGCAVLVCSTDHEELARLASRVLVMISGRVQAELAQPIDPDEITELSLARPKGLAS